MSKESNSLLYKEAVTWLYDMGCDEAVFNSIRPFYGLRVKEDNFDSKDGGIRPINVFNIDNIKDIEELENYIKLYMKNKYNTANSKLVFCDGNKNADLLIVGDKPDKSDIKLGKPFQGETGNLLDAMLKAINFDRDNTFLTNINFYDSLENFEYSLLVVKKIISIIKPKVVIMFGSESTKALTNINKGIFYTRGKWLDIVIEDFNLVVPGISMFHPRYVLMNPDSKKESWVDLKAIRQKYFGK